MLLGLTAFMPLRLENIIEYQYIPVPEYRWLLYGMISAKCVACFYLALLVVLRYYLFSGYAVFIMMPAIFPSAYEQQQRFSGDAPHADGHPQEAETPHGVCSAESSGRHRGDPLDGPGFYL